MTLCSRCGSPIPEVEPRFQTKLTPKERRELELIAADTCERLSPEPLRMCAHIGELLLMTKWTRDYINNTAHLLAEMPEGIERAQKLCKEITTLQMMVNVTLEKMGLANECKWHKFLPDLTNEANRKDGTK